MSFQGKLESTARFEPGKGYLHYSPLLIRGIEKSLPLSRKGQGTGSNLSRIKPGAGSCPEGGMGKGDEWIPGQARNDMKLGRNDTRKNGRNDTTMSPE